MGNSRHRRAPCGPGCDYCLSNLTFGTSRGNQVSEEELHYFLQEGELQAWRDGWIFRDFDDELAGEERAKLAQARALDALR